MKSAAIVFQPSGCMFDFSKSVNGKYALVQNALINVVTMVGTDGIHSTRGTNLYKKAVQGGITDVVSAAHAAAAAAVDTVFTTRQYDSSDQTPKLSGLNLSPAKFDGTRLELSAVFLFDDQTTLGVTTAV